MRKTKNVTGCGLILNWFFDKTYAESPSATCMKLNTCMIERAMHDFEIDKERSFVRAMMKTIFIGQGAPA